PIDYGQYRAFRDHVGTMKHADTTLWWWQVVTGFAMFFLASIHLHAMLMRPERIGPFESADRVWSDHYWPLYLVLPFVVELGGGPGRHAGVARQRRQGAGRQRGRPLRGHGARQRLGRRPARRPHVRRHRAEGGARARRLGRAVEPRREGRPAGDYQRPEGDAD